jgi:DNA-directed RNA polymerase I, II, and III subunit RPABC2
MDPESGDITEEVEEVEEIEIEEDLQVLAGSRRKREANDRITLPVLGKFAMAKLLATRAKQLEMNDPPRIPKERLTSTRPEKIAEQELKERVIPLKVVRYLPDNTYEEWSVKDFKYFAKR